MIIVGIDMSKNSPGVCIRDGNKLTFKSYMRGKITKKHEPFFDKLLECGVTLDMNPRGMGKLEYSESESWKLDDASKIAKSIVDSLPDKVDMVGIEGFSYGSKGNAALDIAGYAYCVRYLLYMKYGADKFCVFAPGAVKKKAGKGNAGKEQIMEFFMDSQIEELRQNKMWIALKDQTLENRKPIDDLVDAFYVQECAYDKFLEETESKPELNEVIILL